MNRLLTAALRSVSLAPAVERSRQFDADLARFQRACEPSLSTVDCTGLLTGNADLEQSLVWHPATVAARPAPLPGHEHYAALASIRLLAE